MPIKHSPAEVIRLFERVSNWGRWGTEDQRGALNFITNQKRVDAARLIRSGEMASLGLPLATTPAADNPNPVSHLMVQAGHDADKAAVPYAGDYLALMLHGVSNTHLDALCHVFWQGKMYNGFDASEVGSQGSRRCSIDVARQGVVSRGVLLDIPKVKKVQWLEPAEVVFAADLDAAEREHRVGVEQGDVLVIRTGRAQRRKVKGAWDVWTEGMPGLDVSCLPWLHERGVALLVSDGGNDVIPSPYEKIAVPIHIGCLVMMGVHMIDNADLEGVAAACARSGHYDFMFSVGPLVLERGTASPVNPIALF